MAIVMTSAQALYLQYHAGPAVTQYMSGHFYLAEAFPRLRLRVFLAWFPLLNFLRPCPPRSGVSGAQLLQSKTKLEGRLTGCQVSRQAARRAGWQAGR